jgi:hypothetical protein
MTDEKVTLQDIQEEVRGQTGDEPSLLLVDDGTKIEYRSWLRIEITTFNNVVVSRLEGRRAKQLAVFHRDQDVKHVAAYITSILL